MEMPRWIETFSQVARPGVLVAMFGLLVWGGIFFALIELLMPGEGTRAMGAFVGFFAAINDQYYETLRFIFGAYVVGRSGQEIAKEVTKQKAMSPQTTDVDNATINADTATVNTGEAKDDGASG